MTIVNCILLLIVFFNVLSWMLTGRGVEYFARLSNASRYVFYTLLIISILYSVFISYLLFSFKQRGPALMAFWDIFLGLFILVPWIGGYAMLKYINGVHADIDFTSTSSLMKGGLGISLILLGLAFKKLKLISTRTVIRGVE